MKTLKRILIIDDHNLFAEGLALILESSNKNYKVDISDNAQKSLINRKTLINYDLVLIDLHMPNLSGFGFLSAIKAQSINVNIAVISGSDKLVEIERAITLGAQGYIPKGNGSEEFINAANQLLQGKRYLPLAWVGKVDWNTNIITESTESNLLTERQIEVLELMRDGLQNKQIAIVLGIKPSSVKGHVEQLFKKIQVNNRTACVQIAQERNLI